MTTNGKRAATRTQLGRFPTVHPSSSWPIRYPGESAANFALRIAHGFRDMPEAYHLHRIRWQIMGHLTFKQLHRLPERKRRHRFKLMARTVCESHRARYRKEFWALREEVGTRKYLSPHLHFSIAALPGHIDLAQFSLDCARNHKASPL